jgi:hypothetical protein
VIGPGSCAHPTLRQTKETPRELMTSDADDTSIIVSVSFWGLKTLRLSSSVIIEFHMTFLCSVAYWWGTGTMLGTVRSPTLCSLPSPLHFCCQSYTKPETVFFKTDVVCRTQSSLKNRERCSKLDRRCMLGLFILKRLLVDVNAISC